MTEDPMAVLRAADPARRGDLSRVDRGALDALREGITMTTTTRTTAPPARRRTARRAALTGGLAVLLAGGGVAYATYDSWYRYSGGGDGLTCTLEYSTNGSYRDVVSGGPSLTGDPIADCQRYQELTGQPPIPDPVAFRDQWYPVVVAPADQVPEGVEVLTAQTPEDLVRRELEASLMDRVDGLGSWCATAEETATFVAAELTRLGLDDDWRAVDERPSPEPQEYATASGTMIDPPYTCGAAVLHPDDHEVELQPNSLNTREEILASGATVPFVYELADALRSGISEQCLGLAEAEAVVERAVGAEHHWPTSAVEDPDAPCTRVDMEVGGSIQVTLRGPVEAHPAG